MKYKRSLVAAAIAIGSALIAWIIGAIFDSAYHTSLTLSNPNGNGGLELTSGFLYLIAVVGVIVGVIFLITSLNQWVKESEKKG
jgi:hypothetical protein